MHVAFLYEHLQLGGVTKVCFDTARYFAVNGISTVFFAQRVDIDKIAPYRDRFIIETVPEGKLVNDSQMDFLVRKIKEYDIRILFIPGPFKCIPTMLRERTGCKIVFWLHSVPFWEVLIKNFKRQAKYRLYPFRLFYPLAKPVIRFRTQSSIKRRRSIYLNNLNDSDAYLVLCDEYKQDLIEKCGGDIGFASKVFPIQNTLEIKPDVNKEKRKEIVYMGRLTYLDKRVDRLVRIWSKIYKDLPDWSLKIYGSGEETHNLRKQICDLGLDRITLEGFEAQPGRVYEHASILCLTSNFEGVPLVMLEAQNYGVVPIAFDCVAGIRYVVSGEAGIGIVPYNEEKYASALYKMCSDEVYLETLRKNCLKKRLSYSHGVNDEVWTELFRYLGIDQSFHV